ncbi:hypothetical protein [Lysinibacillus composti]|nr:hypothetical protein [Lysinibacillus composti]
MEKNKYYGRAEGSYDYLKRAYNMYLNADLNDRVMNELERIFRESITDIRSIKRDQIDITTQVSDLKKKPWIWQTREQLSNITKIIEEYNQYEELLKLLFMNLNGCLKLMELYGDSQNSIDYSISSINNLFDEINRNKEQFITNLNSYSEVFKTRLSTNKYHIENQQNIKMAIKSIDNENMYLESTSSTPPEKIYLTVEYGKVVSVHRN